MVLQVIGSGSSGNCYVLTANNGDILIIEAGVKFSNVLKAINYNVSKVVACIVSHRHGDHAKFVNDFLAYGIKVMALEDVIDNCIAGNYRILTKQITPMHGYKVGNFKIFPFDVCHDVPCVGYMVSHEEMGKLLFVTDTMMLEYKFSGINHFLLEANYSDKILQYNIENGITPAAMRSRLLHSHMELGTTKEILKSNDLSAVRNIVLIHLSAANSNAAEFKHEITALCGLPTYIAKKGLQIELNLNPY